MAYSQDVSTTVFVVRSIDLWQPNDGFDYYYCCYYSNCGSAVFAVFTYVCAKNADRQTDSDRPRIMRCVAIGLIYAMQPSNVNHNTNYAYRVADFCNHRNSINANKRDLLEVVYEVR